MGEVIPKALYSETMRLGDATLTVHVLDNGQRVIEDNAELRRVLDSLGAFLPEEPEPREVEDTGAACAGAKEAT